jgi:hypothetical protein
MGSAHIVWVGHDTTPNCYGWRGSQLVEEEKDLTSITRPASLLVLSHTSRRRLPDSPPRRHLRRMRKDFFRGGFRRHVDRLRTQPDRSAHDSKGLPRRHHRHVQSGLVVTHAAREHPAVESRPQLGTPPSD